MLLVHFTTVTKDEEQPVPFSQKSPQGLRQQLCRLTGKHLKNVLKPCARGRAFKRLKNQRLQQLRGGSGRCRVEKKSAERIIMQGRICQSCTAVSQIRLKQGKLQKSLLWSQRDTFLALCCVCWLPKTTLSI